MGGRSHQEESMAAFQHLTRSLKKPLNPYRTSEQGFFIERDNAADAPAAVVVEDTEQVLGVKNITEAKKVSHREICDDNLQPAKEQTNGVKSDGEP